MSARAWAAFAAVSVLWGIPYLFIKVAVDDGVSPVFLAWVRVVLGAGVLVALSWRLGLLGSVRGRWWWLAVFAVVEIVIPFPLIAFGEQHLASSLAAIIIAAAPLFVALLALRFDAFRAGHRLAARRAADRPCRSRRPGRDRRRRPERRAPRRRRGPARGARATRSGRWCSSATSPTSTRRVSMGASLAIAALILTPAAALDPPDRGDSPAPALVSLAVLGVLCTAAAFAIYASLVVEVGAGQGTRDHLHRAGRRRLRCGVAVLDERPGAGAFVGLALILLGSWLATRARPPVMAP